MPDINHPSTPEAGITSSLQASLEAGLENRRRQGKVFQLLPPAQQLGLADFGSNDGLGMRTNGNARRLFLEQLANRPDVFLGAGGSRILDGSHNEVAELERYLADFHGAAEALLFNSGYEANFAFWSTLPRAGDVVLHDAEIHASILDGIRSSRASEVVSFKHNSVSSLTEKLRHVLQSSSPIRDGEKTAFIAIESLYSMDGDMAPAKDMIAAIKGILDNYILVMDEAHSTGLIGPHGSGYARLLGLENEKLIQMQTYSKGAGASGAVILCHRKAKEYLTNYARSLIYSTGPSFPTVAMIRASVETLRSREGDMLRDQLQDRVRLFHDLVSQRADWELVRQSGVLRLPTLLSTDPLQNHVPIMPLITPPGMSKSLKEELEKAGFNTHALGFPVVPRDAERVRCMLHSFNTPDEIARFVDTMMGWAVRQTRGSEKAAVKGKL